MSPVHFGAPLFLWLLPLVVAGAAALFWWSWRVKQKLLRLFIGSRLLEGLLAGVSPRRERWRLGLLLAAVAFIFLALARPQWGFVWEEAHQRGLDILVAIDTSRSMLAQDVRPNRLEKAKLAAYDLMRQAKSDRLGLIAFAGTAFLQAPLTLDDEAFRQNVEALNVGIIPQGGTALSTAIREAMAAFEKGNDNHKVLVLFTDGEDHDADTETLAAAKDAADAGLSIFTIGVGTPEGELLRVTDEQGNASFIKDDDGNVVKSRLNQTLLQQIATAAHGFYLPLQGASPMDTLYQRGLAPLPKSEATTKLTRAYAERYHWPLALAILCLLAEALLPETSANRRRSRNQTPVAATAAVVSACLLLTVTAHASPSSAYRDYENGDYKDSLNEYSRLADQKTNDYRLKFDAGTAAYKAKQLDTAEKQFNAALAAPEISSDLQTQAHTYYDLGNTLYRLGEPLEPDKKKQRWEQAIDNYGHALRLNTNDIDAKNNLAYVKQKLEELKQQQQQQQQNKDQDKKDQEKNQKQNQEDQKSQDQKDKDQDQKKQQDQKDAQQKENKDQKQQDADKQKEDQQKQQQAQQDKDKDKNGEQKQAEANPSDQRDKSKEDGQQAMAAQMTPEEAREILDSQRDDEKALIFSPENQPVKTQTGKIKDW